MKPAAVNSGQGLEFNFEGQPFILEFDFAAIAAFEAAAGTSLVLALAEIEGGLPRVSHVVWLLAAGLRKHHPEAAGDLDKCLAMLSDEQVKAELFGALNIALPDAGEGEGAGEPGAAKGSTGTT